MVSFAALTLAGCDETGGFSFGAGGNRDAADGATSGQAVQLVERDVEAPDVFQVTDSGLWDGRPSLGGVWVAHPDVADPERVIIRNTENGKFVIGALFRREREQPGPALQVSSDAAAALEMLAGAPASLNVTALRREEVPAEAPPAAIADFDEPAEIEATTLDPIASAAAAIDAAEASGETAVAAAPAAPAPRPAAPASSLEKPFIQIGIFSVKANAERAADMMRATGIVPTVLEQSSQGRTFWRVIVGPAGTTADRAALLEQVKGQGFTDAYFVTN
ncbi:SPOR domain-containing protein [Loktanella sp. IMCC34160]|nr:SPOR domain-containing protein [Loktanella sp. IMCC34160]